MYICAYHITTRSAAHLWYRKRFGSREKMLDPIHEGNLYLSDQVGGTRLDETWKWARSGTQRAQGWPIRGIPHPDKHICMYMYVYVCICMYMCIYVDMNT